MPQPPPPQPKKQVVRIQTPNKGLIIVSPRTQQPPDSVPAALNVWLRDRDLRSRLGQRFGCTKAYATQVAGTQPMIQFVAAYAGVIAGKP